MFVQQLDDHHGNNHLGEAGGSPPSCSSRGALLTTLPLCSCGLKVLSSGCARTAAIVSGRWLSELEWGGLTGGGTGVGGPAVPDLSLWNCARTSSQGGTLKCCSQSAGGSSIFCGAGNSPAEKPTLMSGHRAACQSLDNRLGLTAVAGGHSRLFAANQLLQGGGGGGGGNSYPPGRSKNICRYSVAMARYKNAALAHDELQRLSSPGSMSDGETSGASGPCRQDSWRLAASI